MKKRLTPILGILLVAAVMVLLQLRGTEVAHAEFDAAMAQAKSEGKCLFLVFTGSDWCGWCVKLDQEVFSRKAFKEYARGNLAMVVVDFPRSESAQSAEQRKQNQKLAKKFNVHGFPTAFILNPNGKPIAKTGYQAGGPEAYIEHIKKLTSNAKK